MKCEVLPSIAVGWQTSAVRDEEADHYCEVAGMSIVTTGGPRFVLLIDTFICRQPLFQIHHHIGRGS